MKICAVFLLTTLWLGCASASAADDAQNAVQKAHNDRCAAFAAAGVEC